MKRAICLITINPNKIWLDFLNNFEKYDIYILVDNLLFNYDFYKDSYTKIKFIKITDLECKHFGFIHSSYMPNSSLKFNEIIAWDRALCYFTNFNNKYEQIWFFEDDVFFYSENTISNIDSQFIHEDLLCKDKNPEPKEGEWCWFWPAIKIYFDGPYFHSPICAIRLSKNYLEKLNDYVKINKKLAFIEALIPSIASNCKLNVSLVNEFKKIHWRKDWELSEMNSNDIFHPVKNMEQQKDFRQFVAGIIINDH
jgi:hypothetical protein